MTSQMFSAIAAVTGQGQNPNTTPAQWSSSQYGYGGSTGGGGSSSAYHVSATFKVDNTFTDQGLWGVPDFDFEYELKTVGSHFI